MSKIQAIIFDLYGTLVDIATNEDKKEIFDYLSLYFQYYGANITGKNLRLALDAEKERYLQTHHERYPELDLEVIFDNILKREGINNPFLTESCCKLYRLISRDRFQLFPDSLPVLREMKRSGYPLALISDAQKVFTLEEARMLGVDQFFQHVLLSTDFGFKKPDPRLFDIAAALLEVPPANAVYIGDNADKDIPGAKRTGMPVILVDRAARGNNQKAEPPDFYATDLWSAWSWIKNQAQYASV